jgi:hypothetical protein
LLWPTGWNRRRCKPPEPHFAVIFLATALKRRSPPPKLLKTFAFQIADIVRFSIAADTLIDVVVIIVKNPAKNTIGNAHLSKVVRSAHGQTTVETLRKSQGDIDGVCIPVKPAPYSGANRHSSQEAMLQGRSEATLT